MRAFTVVDLSALIIVHRAEPQTKVSPSTSSWGGEKNQRNIVRGRILLDAPAGFVSIDARHKQVKQNEIGSAAAPAAAGAPLHRFWPAQNTILRIQYSMISR